MEKGNDDIQQAVVAAAEHEADLGKEFAGHEADLGAWTKTKEELGTRVLIATKMARFVALSQFCKDTPRREEEERH